MVKFGEKEIIKKKSFMLQKKTNIWDVNVDNIVVSKLILSI